MTDALTTRARSSFERYFLMRPIDLIYNIAFLHIRLIWDMEVRFSSINITSRLRASFVTETVVVVWLYYKPFGAKRFFHHSHVGLQFTSSAYCYFVALCLFHSVLYSVRVLYLVLILYPVRSPGPQSAVLVLYWPIFVLAKFCPAIPKFLWEARWPHG